MERWIVKSLELVIKLSFLGKKNPAVIPYTPQKTEVSPLEKEHFPRVKPVKCGVSNSLLYKMLDELEKEQRANIHNLLVIKDDAVICECSAPGYNIHLRHLSHSMSKSIVGMALGFLVDDGLIDLESKVYTFFPEYTPKDKSFKKISVKHLLTMQSGIAFNEAGSVSETEWTRAFIESKVKFEPGTLFAYNSMNSYLLTHIVARVAKTSFLEFVNERLFKPLNIDSYFWEKSPEGIEKGGWGLYLSTESWAKIGSMMLHGGVYGTNQVLSKEWVAQSTKTHAAVTEKAGGFNYGYQLWVSRTNDEFLFNGMLGQNVWMCPKNNLIVSVNAENNELFQKSAALEILQKYLGGDLQTNPDEEVSYPELKKKQDQFFEYRRWIYPRPILHGIKYRLGLKNSIPFLNEWNVMLGKFSFADNNQGILPLFIRAMQNNYTGGIESMSFHRRFNTLFFTVCEGGKDIRLEVGLYGYAENTLDFGGEKYTVLALGSAVKNQEGEMLYKIELVFPEMPNRRYITMRRLKDGKLSVFMDEIPNQKIAEPFVEGLYTMTPKLSFIIGIIEKRLGDRFIANKLKKTFSPVLIGVNVASTDYHRQLYEIQDKNEAKNKRAESVASLLIQMSDKESNE